MNTAKTQRRNKVRHLRHAGNNEPPLPVSVGLLVHTKTRKKGLVNQLAKEGLSVKYERVKAIKNGIAAEMCKKYLQEGIVCPPKLVPGLFTTSDIDNIDHNPSSTTAGSSFHGTPITIFQHPDTLVEKYVLRNMSLILI